MEKVRKKHQPVIGLAMFVDPWVREEAAQRGWRLLNVLYGDFSLPPGIQLDGVLSATPIEPRIWNLRESGVPVVRLGQLPHERDVLIPAVLHDMQAEGKMAAQHFHERGFRDVGFFGMDPWSDNYSLYKGFHEEASARDMNCHLFRLKVAKKASLQRERQIEKQQGFVKWLQQVPKPIGLVAGGSWFAASYCSWAIQAGFLVPDDVAVIGSQCSVDICEYSMPTISTIDRDEELRSRKACDVLALLMDGGLSPAQVWIPPKSITERASTNVLATFDRDVAAALRYMWDNLRINLSIEDVARQVNMSSRQLERRFHDALGRGVNAELQRRRLQEFRRQLVSTKIPIADLTPMFGFGSTSYLHRLFQKTFGTTPSKYRRAKMNA